jgi:hypothetical protein
MNWYKARVLLLLACMVLVCASALSAQQKVQSNFILSPKGLNLFFKYEDEYLAKARPEGRTIVFGFSWTLRDPKPQAAKK